MRKLIGLLVIVALLWGGWWWLASAGMARGIENWFSERRDAGWQADVGPVRRAGFPLRLHVTLEGAEIADPDSGVALALPQLDIETPIYWPGDVTVTLPPRPVTLSSPEGRATLTADDAVARLRLHPGTALELDGMGLTTGAWTLNGPDAPLLAAQSLSATVQQDAADSARYQIDMQAVALTPGAASRGLLNLPADWSRSFDAFDARMDVTFDRPWDRAALEGVRPQPRQIKLSQAQVKWADLHLLMAADIDVDADGRGTGRVDLKADNWPAMLDMSVAAGLIPPGFRDQAEGLITNFAAMSGNPDTLDVTLTLKDGRMSLGFIPLGPAPLFLLR